MTAEVSGRGWVEHLHFCTYRGEPLGKSLGIVRGIELGVALKVERMLAIQAETDGVHFDRRPTLEDSREPV